MHTTEALHFPWIDRLIGFDTTSSKSNLDLIDDVSAHLTKRNIPVVRTTNKEGTKANIFATIANAAGDTNGGIVLSGHTDVVPVTGQSWTVDPFVATYQSNRIYGRGACDMKGFLGIVLEEVPRICEVKLSIPVHLALSFDEEIGCAGIPHLLADLAARGIMPRGCIVGEPTSMRLVVGHKGINTFRCSFKGRAAHSSLQPYGVNAVEYGSQLVERIRLLAEAHRDRGPFDDRFEVPHLTAQTGRIDGGIAVNTVPDQCTVEFEFRNLPVTNPLAIRKELRDFAENELSSYMSERGIEEAVRWEDIASSPALETSSDEQIVQLVKKLIPDQRESRVGYGTEAGLFQASGIPIVVCGPGDIRQAHRADEYTSFEDLVRCRRFLKDLTHSLQSD